MLYARRTLLKFDAYYYWIIDNFDPFEKSKNNDRMLEFKMRLVHFNL